jgi:4-amino-4-deoxychorismate lyase
MCRLVESIKVEDRQLIHIEWHNLRFNEARREAFGVEQHVNLEDLIVIPKDLSSGVYKCRVLYKQQIEAIEFQPYTPGEIETLRLVDGGNIDYHLKLENRKALNELLSQKGEADDILIVKDGCITDTSYANIAFFDGSQWFTPDTYLLNGTQRQRLLAEGFLTEARVTPADLVKYTIAKPINAMLDLEKTPCVTIHN